MSGANEEEGRSLNPPYVGWEQFGKAFESIKKLNPTRLSKEQLTGLGLTESNATKTIPALKFLGILGQDGAPNARVWKSLHEEGELYRKAVATLVRQAYSAIFDAFPDVTTVSRAQIASTFLGHWRKLSRNNRQQAVNFFAAICEEAGITLGFQTRRRGRRKDKSTATDAGESQRRGEQRIQRRKPNRSAGAAAPVFSVVIQVSGDEEEGDLEQAFRKVKRAYETVFGGE